MAPRNRNRLAMEKDARPQEASVVYHSLDLEGNLIETLLCPFVGNGHFLSTMKWSPHFLRESRVPIPGQFKPCWGRWRNVSGAGVNFSFLRNGWIAGIASEDTRDGFIGKTWGDILPARLRISVPEILAVLSCPNLLNLWQVCEGNIAWDCVARRLACRHLRSCKALKLASSSNVWWTPQHHLDVMLLSKGRLLGKSYWWDWELCDWLEDLLNGISMIDFEESNALSSLWKRSVGNMPRNCKRPTSFGKSRRIWASTERQRKAEKNCE